MTIVAADRDRITIRAKIVTATQETYLYYLLFTIKEYLLLVISSKLTLSATISA